jgi:transcriptional regulator of acetoin/glycerol metabolism
LKAFLEYPWSGNMLEIEHTTEHAFILCSQNIITFDNLPPDFMSAPGIKRSSPDEIQDTDPHAILEALDKTAWNKAKAARFPGMDRVTLYRKIKRYNLTKDIP